MTKETSNYWPLFLAYMDGPGSTGYSDSIYPPAQPDACCQESLRHVCRRLYEQRRYYWTTLLHTPGGRIPGTATSRRYLRGGAAGQLPKLRSRYYCIDFNLQPDP